MSEVMSKAFNLANHRVNEMNEMIDWCMSIDNLSEVAECAVEAFIYSDYICFHIKPNLETLCKIRKALGKRWRFVDTHSNSAGGQFLNYRLRADKATFGRRVTVYRDPTLVEGSSCKLVETGTRTVTEYKIVCEKVASL